MLEVSILPQNILNLTNVRSIDIASEYTKQTLWEVSASEYTKQTMWEVSASEYTKQTMW
jgi:hypothetical protein